MDKYGAHLCGTSNRNEDNNSFQLISDFFASSGLKYFCTCCCKNYNWNNQFRILNIDLYLFAVPVNLYNGYNLTFLQWVLLQRVQTQQNNNIYASCLEMYRPVIFITLRAAHEWRGTFSLITKLVFGAYLFLIRWKQFLTEIWKLYTD